MKAFVCDIFVNWILASVEKRRIDSDARDGADSYGPSPL